jgi:hypothetical protein
MLLESGIMFSVAAIIFLVSYYRNSAFQNVVLNAVGGIEVSLSSHILQLRRGLTAYVPVDCTDPDHI